MTFNVRTHLGLLLLVAFIAVLAAIGDDPLLWIALVAATLVFIVYTHIQPPASVDIWHHQEELMRMSGQGLPACPVFTDGSALYLGLQLEELSEQFKTAADIMNVDPGASTNREQMLQALLADMHPVLKSMSEEIRQHVRGINNTQDGMVMGMTKAQATQLLDDVTDVAVVTAGFGLACGLPAREAYAETAFSNASKANPKTGVIDKLPDGKWIKGPNYREPDFESLLSPYYVK